MASGGVRTINLHCYPNGLAYDSGKSGVYVDAYANSPHKGFVLAISDRTDKVVANTTVGSTSLGWIVYDSVKDEIFTVDTSSEVYVISDGNNQVVANFTVGAPQLGIGFNNVCFDSGRGEIFVANPNMNVSVSGNNVLPNFLSNATVSVISDVSNSLVANVTLPGYNADALAYDPYKGEVFVGHVSNSSGEVAVVSDSSSAVVDNIALGFGPAGMVYDSDNNDVYAADANGTLVAISDQTNSVVSTMTLKLATPWILTYDSGKGEIFDIDFNSNAFNRSVSAISTHDYSVTANITPGYLPSDITYDSSKGEVFVSNALPGVLSVIPDEPGTSTFNAALIVAVTAVGAIAVCAAILVRRRCAKAHTESSITQQLRIRKTKRKFLRINLVNICAPDYWEECCKAVQKNRPIFLS